MGDELPNMLLEMQKNGCLRVAWVIVGRVTTSSFLRPLYSHFQAPLVSRFGAGSRDIEGAHVT